jgi:hypothetical protein
MESEKDRDLAERGGTGPQVAGPVVPSEGGGIGAKDIPRVMA